MTRTISFVISEKEYADLKIKLRHDGLSQQNLLQSLIKRYVDNSSLFLGLLKSIMAEKSDHSATRLSEVASLYEKGASNTSEYFMSEEEKNNFYSLLEEENGDL